MYVLFSWLHGLVLYCCFQNSVNVFAQRFHFARADPEGGQGVRTPPGKSQFIWVSIANKQLDPPWKKLDPAGKCWNPSGGTLKRQISLILTI